MKKIVNNPQLTAIERTSISFPTRWLKQNNLLKGEILDFGCGFGFDTDQLKEQGFDILGYDNYYRPDYPEKRFDTIVCNYVLNKWNVNMEAFNIFNTQTNLRKIFFLTAFFLLSLTFCDLENRYPDAGEFCTPMKEVPECVQMDFRNKNLILIALTLFEKCISAIM